MKYKKETDQYVGFFGYEILNYLLGIKISKQSKNSFYKGVFYKPETIIKIRDNISIFSNKKKQEFNNYFKPTKILSPFKLNIKYQKYKKIFDIFSKKIRQGETYQIKICTKYRNKSSINPINFFDEYVLDVKSNQEVNEFPESRGIGIIFHNTMEEIYKPFIGKMVDVKKLKITLKTII